MVKCLDCDKRAYFNLPTEKNGLYCFTHKKENMINVINKKCIQDGCNTIPNFNLPTERNALHVLQQIGYNTN